MRKAYINNSLIKLINRRILKLNLLPKGKNKIKYKDRNTYPKSSEAIYLNSIQHELFYRLHFLLEFQCKYKYLRQYKLY